jgi:hypothetical protein
MSKHIPWDTVIVGDTLGPIEYVVDKDAVEQYCDDWKDCNPIYLEDSPFGGPVVPPAFRAGLDSFRLLATKFDSHATVGVKTEHEYINPAKIGKRLITTGKIADKYIKRGIEYVVIEYSMVDEDGAEIRRSVDHIALSVERVTGS